MWSTKTMTSEIQYNIAFYSGQLVPKLFMLREYFSRQIRITLDDFFLQQKHGYILPGQ